MDDHPVCHKIYNLINNFIRASIGYPVDALN